MLLQWIVARIFHCSHCYFGRRDSIKTNFQQHLRHKRFSHWSCSLNSAVRYKYRYKSIYLKQGQLKWLWAVGQMRMSSRACMGRQSGLEAHRMKSPQYMGRLTAALLNLTISVLASHIQANAPKRGKKIPCLYVCPVRPGDNPVAKINKLARVADWKQRIVHVHVSLVQLVSFMLWCGSTFETRSWKHSFLSHIICAFTEAWGYTTGITICLRLVCFI